MRALKAALLDLVGRFQRDDYRWSTEKNVRKHLFRFAGELFESAAEAGVNVHDLQELSEYFKERGGV